jgi:hypothetical protein
MKCAVSRLAVIVLAAFALQLARAQTMSHEEELVRNSYAKLSFAGELTAISPAAFNIQGNGQDGPRRSDTVLLAEDVARTTPTFVLSDFKTGAIADIANAKWSQFITERPVEYLGGSLRDYSYDFSGNKTNWTAMEMKWTQNKAPFIPTDEYLQLTVTDAMKTQQVGLWSNQTGHITRYVAYTVNATFQGKSTGSYRAIAVFATDDHGKEVFSIADRITDMGLLYGTQTLPMYPGAFLSSDWRTVPVISAWIRSHEMPVSSCTGVAADEVCCSDGRCGISETDLNRELSAPLPSPKPSGGVQ